MGQKSMSADDFVCENCSNDNDVALSGLNLEDVRLLCHPCREAFEVGDEVTLKLRRMYLYSREGEES